MCDSNVRMSPGSLTATQPCGKTVSRQNTRYQPRLILFLASVLLAFLVMPTWVYADGCTQYTVMTSKGMTFCQSCCYGGQCQVSCL